MPVSTPLKLKKSSSTSVVASPVTEHKWRILVVDDEAEIHTVTRMILSKISYKNRSIEILSAYSATEALVRLRRERDIAIILLDVVMETDDAGLKLIQTLREEIGNTAIRIILRTGQPGQAPEENVTLNYDINDYKAKNELTAQKLFTSVIAALRSFETISSLEYTHRRLEKILDSTSILFQSHSLPQFASKVLTQLAAFFDCQSNGMICMQRDPKQLYSESESCKDLHILAGSGEYNHCQHCQQDECKYPQMLKNAHIALRRQENILTNEYTVIYLCAGDTQAAVTMHYGGLSTATDDERRLLDIFSAKIALTLANALTYKKKVDAEAANRAKSAFLANMSHELRTPLNAVLGYAQILQNDQNLSTIQRQGIDTINRSGNHLLTLINDILDLAKVESGHLELDAHNFNLQRFFAEMIDLFRLRATEKGLNLYYQAVAGLPTEVHADEKRLRQICLNLLGNAVKFTEQGEVRLEAEYRDNQLIISVTDTGIGISELMREQIFQPFVQTGESRYKNQGTGLGLAISRKLVECMGGHIELKSVQGVGSNFRVHVPITVVQVAPPVHEVAEHTPTIIGTKRTDGLEQPLQILVVDDIIDNRLILRGLLEPLGFQITEAADGAAAVNITAQQAFDLILMDLVMPDMDGLTAIRHILGHPGNVNKRIVALTASAFAEDRIASQTIGCVDYLVKPVDRSTLLQALHTHLPVEWLYTTLSPTLPLTSTHNIPLSETQRELLLDMVECGAVIEITSYLENLLTTHDCPNQAHDLLALAKSFKLADMLHVLSG